MDNIQTQTAVTAPSLLSLKQDIGGTGTLWAWYAFLVVFCCIGNITHFLYVWRATHSADDTYSQAILYLQRYVFWDTPLNGILVDRGFACVGELCCVLQTTLALCHVDKQITGGRSWIQTTGWLSFVIYIIAEGCSYYNVATTNELWCAIEVSVDAMSYVIILPAAIYLLILCPGAIMGLSAKKFLAIMVPVTIFYPLYNFFIDAPMYLRRYAVDQAAGKHYYGFLEGLKDAATRRIFTHDYDDWKEDMTWMVLYFFLGAIGSILLMYAPKLSTMSKELKNSSSLMTMKCHTSENDTVQPWIL